MVVMVVIGRNYLRQDCCGCYGYYCCDSGGFIRCPVRRAVFFGFG